MTAHATMNTNKENSMTQFGTVEPQAQGDTFKPQEHYGSLIVVQPVSVRTGIPKRQPKAGEDPNMSGLVCNILDLDGKLAPRSDDESGKPGNIYLNSILFGGAWLDTMSAKLGQLVVVAIERKKSGSSGFDYASPRPAGDAEIKRAQEYWAANGDPFVKFDTTDPLS